MTCPHCGSTRLFGPATIKTSDGRDHDYYDCARCHALLLVEDDGTLTPKAGAW